MEANEIQVVFTARKFDYEPFTGSIDVQKLLQQVYDENTIEYREEFYVVFLNQQNGVLGVNKVATGGISGVMVDFRMIFQIALKTNSSAIILSHNHPSGNLKPSQADIDLTNSVKKAGTILNIRVLDHMILTKESYYSFADNGLM